MDLVKIMRTRELSRMTPKFLGRTVARQQSESQERVGGRVGTHFPLQLLLCPCLQNKGCWRCGHNILICPKARRLVEGGCTFQAGGLGLGAGAFSLSSASMSLCDLEGAAHPSGP